MYKVYEHSYYEINLVTGEEFNVTSKYPNINLNFIITKSNVGQFFKIFDKRTGIMLECIEVKTVRRAIQIFLNKGNEYFNYIGNVLQNYSSVQDRQSNLEKYRKLVKEFKNIEGCNTIPLDVLSLDRQLDLPESISIKDYITTTYGKRASDLYQEIISIQLW